MPEPTDVATAYARHLCFLRGIRVRREYRYCPLNTIRKIFSDYWSMVKQI